MSAIDRAAWRWALALSAVLAPAVAGALGARAVEGSDRVRLLPPAGARVEAYDNAGYRLRWVGDEVAIEVDASPLASRARFEAPQGSETGPVSRLARALTAGAETEYEAISRILGWVARHLEYDLDRHQPQDAEAVLARRSGYCTGVARSTVALLEAAGIPAREVAGYVVGSQPGHASGYHRWIEAFLSDRGWVFSDPLATHHYVSATYLRLGAESLEPARGTEGLLLEREDAMATVDLYPLAGPGITARRNSERQLAAALRVRIEDHSHGTAVLEGTSQRWIHALVGGTTTFVGLDPGSYRIRLLLPDEGVFESLVELPGRIRKTLRFRAPEQWSGRPPREPPAAAGPPRGERD